MRNLLFDFRDALRGLRRDRVYSVAVVLTCALTIGATTAVFSIVNGVLLRPVAYRESSQLVVVREIIAELSQRYPTLPVNPRHFHEWRTRATSFHEMSAFLPTTKIMTGQEGAVQIKVVETSGNLFALLGVRAAVGRALEPGDERAERDLTVLLTDREWRRRFHADPAVIGRRVALDGKPHTIVGVLEPGFRLLQFDGLGSLVQVTRDVEAFVPLRINPTQVSPMGEFDYTVVARLESAVTAATALAELNVIQASIARDIAGDKLHMSAQLTPLLDAVVGRARRGLVLL